MADWYCSNLCISLLGHIAVQQCLLLLRNNSNRRIEFNYVRQHQDIILQPQNVILQLQDIVLQHQDINLWNQDNFLQHKDNDYRLPIPFMPVGRSSNCSRQQLCILAGPSYRHQLYIQGKRTPV